MDSQARFQRSIDSQFIHLGRDAIYHSQHDASKPIRVIPRRPEQLFELGEGHIHAENPSLEFRVSEVSSPIRGDVIKLGSRHYQLDAEPRLDLHQLVWIAACLPVVY